MVLMLWFSTGGQNHYPSQRVQSLFEFQKQFTFFTTDISTRRYIDIQKNVRSIELNPVDVTCIKESIDKPNNEKGKCFDSYISGTNR